MYTNEAEFGLSNMVEILLKIITEGSLSYKLCIHNLVVVKTSLFDSMTLGI